MADLAFLESLLENTIGALRNVRRAIELREQNGESTADLRALEKQYEGEILALRKQISAAQQTLPVDSAGETVARAQRANDDGADTVSPDAPPAAPPNATNADRFGTRTSTDIGVNDQSLPTTTTQSIPATTARPGPPRIGSPDDGVRASPTTKPGNATNDNAAGGPGGSGGVTTRINSIFGGDAGRIIAQPNALDGLASYTYSISLYLLSPQDFRTMLLQKVPPKGWQLILQSAGAPLGGGIIPGGQLDVNIEDPGQAAELQRANLSRNEFFNLDLYIDDIEIKHLMPNRGTLSPHMSTEIKFKIYEPNGLTFLPNLYNAVQQYVALRGGQPSVQNQVYTSQNFLMVIRFYGYDEKGNLVTAANRTNQITSTTGLVLQEASETLITKYIPLQFRRINFRVQNKITEYDCEAVVPPSLINIGSARGTIPYNIQLTSQTLRDLLTGPSEFLPNNDATRQTGTASPGTGFVPRQGVTPPVSSVPVAPPNSGAPEGTAPGEAPTTGSVSPAAVKAPPKATAASKAAKMTVSKGLQDALNKFQEELVKEGVQEYPDIYEIDIPEDVIASAKILPPGRFNPRQSAMIKPETAKEAKDGATQSVDTDSKHVPATAGQSIVQFLDRAVRTSSYVLEQQLEYVDSVNGAITKNPNPAKTVGWYRIGLEAEPTGFYDRKRNDFQYRIKYSIAAYQVNDVKSDYFPRTQFQGVHKVYPYWFTGENTQVLTFEQSFNNLFYIVQNIRSRPKTTSNYLEADRFYFQTLNTESSQGQDDMRVYDGAASAASWLYSPGDQATVKLNIVGDPAWIFQGETAFGIQDLKTNYRAFLPDGSVNPTRGEVLFEIVFNQPRDYDLATGLIDAGKFNYGTNTAARNAGIYDNVEAGKPRERYVYRARTCTSSFRQGRFTQELEGAIVTFPYNPTPSPGVRQESQGRTEQQTAAINDASEGRTPVRTTDVSGQTTPENTGLVGFNTKDALQLSIAPATNATPASGLPNPLPQQPNQAPTSTTQIVGQPATDRLASAQQASGNINSTAAQVIARET